MAKRSRGVTLVDMPRDILRLIMDKKFGARSYWKKKYDKAIAELKKATVVVCLRIRGPGMKTILARFRKDLPMRNVFYLVNKYLSQQGRKPVVEMQFFDPDADFSVEYEDSVTLSWNLERVVQTMGFREYRKIQDKAYFGWYDIQANVGNWQEAIDKDLVDAKTREWCSIQLRLLRAW